MRVFVTGATGFIGSAVVKELIGAGHEVIGLARSDASAKALVAAGAQVHRGSLEDLESLRSGAALAEGAVHTAFFHALDHANLTTRLRVLVGGSPTGIIGRFMGAALEADRRAIETIGSALTGSDRAFVVAFGTMALEAGRLATERDASDPRAVGGRRGENEAAVRALVARGVRASVVRLPPTVHGEGDQGFIARIITTARKSGVSTYVGDGHNRWPAVHRLDAARAFRLALEQGDGTQPFHAVAEEGVPFVDIANLIGQRLKVPIASATPRAAAKAFSWLAPFVAADNPVSSQQTRDILGWEPTHAGLLADMDRWYFSAKGKSGS